MTLLAMQSPAVAGAKALAPGGAAGQAMRILLGRQFAEAFYFMVMGSDLRNRAKALGCRYGLESVEMRAETMRYIERVLDNVPFQGAIAPGTPRWNPQRSGMPAGGDNH
jgi:hypothetical protein